MAATVYSCKLSSNFMDYSKERLLKVGDTSMCVYMFVISIETKT